MGDSEMVKSNTIQGWDCSLYPNNVSYLDTSVIKFSGNANVVQYWLVYAVMASNLTGF